jgi:hypothetical protein
MMGLIVKEPSGQGANSMKSIVRIAGRGKGRRTGENKAVEPQVLEGLDTRVAMIQALIPVALERVNDLLQEELRTV